MVSEETGICFDFEPGELKADETVDLSTTKNIKWVGKGINEKGVDTKTGKIIVKVGKKYFRPTEVDSLLGNPNKAKKILKWKPKITFNQMVKEMIENDYNEQKKLIT